MPGAAPAAAVLGAERHGHRAGAAASPRRWRACASRTVVTCRRHTKLDLARFYESIADWILPHLKDRPTTLVRCPSGAHRQCFYQKHVGYWAPEAIRRVKIREKTKTGEYLVVDTLPALIGLVQIGILEIHTWNSLPDPSTRRRVRPDPDGMAPSSRLRRPRPARRRGLRLREDHRGRAPATRARRDVGPGRGVLAGMAEAMAREQEAYVASMAAERTGRTRRLPRNVRGATTVAAYSRARSQGVPCHVDD